MSIGQTLCVSPVSGLEAKQFLSLPRCIAWLRKIEFPCDSGGLHAGYQRDALSIYRWAVRGVLFDEDGFVDTLRHNQLAVLVIKIYSRAHFVSNSLGTMPIASIKL